nr:1406_t:CDS:2 [Entrophospora candida]
MYWFQNPQHKTRLKRRTNGYNTYCKTLKTYKKEAQMNYIKHIWERFQVEGTTFEPSCQLVEKKRILDFWKDVELTKKNKKILEDLNFEFTLDCTMEHNKEVGENRKLKRIFENHDGSNYIRRSPPTSPQFKLLQ